jgi:3-hydroxyisobutyrate dehydrogenase
MATIGFIGLGNMGLPMAQNLLKAGHKVQGFDVSKAQMDALATSGGTAASSVKAAATGAEVVITMLPAGQHVRDVYTGPDGVLSAAASNTLLIDSSTIDVETARVVAAAAETKSLPMLDAPVSGGVGGATAGTLTYMVGGSVAAY